MVYDLSPSDKNDSKTEILRNSYDISAPEKTHNHIVFSVLVCLEPNIGLTFQFNTYIPRCNEL